MVLKVCFLITFICFLDGKKSHVLCKNNSVRKIAKDGLSKALVKALPCGTVWVDEPSPFVVSGVANYQILIIHGENVIMMIYILLSRSYWK